MNRRRWWGFFIVVSLLTSDFSLLTSFAETTNRIVALVNDEVITEGDVRAYMSALLSPDDAKHVSSASQRAALEQTALQRLIGERLIIQEAKRLGLTVGQDEVVDRLRAIKHQARTKEEYEQMLQETGLSEEQLKAKLRDQLFARKAVDQQVRRLIHVSPNEVAQRAVAYGSGTPVGDPAHSGVPASVAGAVPSAEEEMLVWHLLIRAGDQRSTEDARALATSLRQQAANRAGTIPAGEDVPRAEERAACWACCASSGESSVLIYARTSPSVMTSSFTSAMMRFVVSAKLVSREP